MLLLAVASLLATACGSPTVPSTQPSTGLASPGPASTGGPNTNPEPTEAVPQGDWAAVDLPPLEPIASLEPTKAGDDGVALDTAFRLTSLDGEPVGDLASRVSTDPSIDIQAGEATGDSLLLHPASLLRAGQSYRFTLHRADGSVAHAWAITASRPLNVVGAIPDDQTTGVPVDTGIEVTFDATGVTAGGLEAHFAIEPKVAGRFEVHGRMGAFIPTKPLAPSTLYTVTIKAGLPLPGTEQVLERDRRIQFETVNKAASKLDWMTVPARLVDSATKEQPTVVLNFYDRNNDDKTTVPPRLPVTVHRVATLPAAMADYERLLVAPDWAPSGGAPVDTSGLTQVLAATVRVRSINGDDGSAYLQLPSALPAGWYVLTIVQGDVRQQVLLQVTDLASYAMVTETRTVAWVNSLATGQPVVGATVEIAGDSLGRTGADGTRTAATPDAMLTASTSGPRYMVVRDSGDRSMFVPLDTSGACGKCDSGSPADTAALDAWWHALVVERTMLRSTDHANVWGVVRGRDDGALPKAITLRMVAGDSPDGPAVAEATPTPNAHGMFTADLAFKDLPVGSYQVTMTADGVDLGASYVQVGPIVKPQYQFDVTTDLHAMLTGTPVQATTAATFFDGTPVAGVALRMSTSDPSSGEARPTGANATTGIDGQATATVRPRLTGALRDGTQWSWIPIDALPSYPEEAEIQGEANVAVFRADSLVATDARVDGSTLRVTGSVHAVDFAKMERADSLDYDIDPAGAPRAGATVRLRITRLTDVRRQVGTGYDFVTKRTSPIYQYDRRETVLPAVTVRTRSDGTFQKTIRVGSSNSDYDVLATYTDRAGRKVAAQAYGTRYSDLQFRDNFAVVAPTSPDDDRYLVGDTIKVRALGGHPRPADDRYLFLVTHRGLRTAKVQSGPSFATEFRSAWIPSLRISAVRFNGFGYDVDTAGYAAELDTHDQTLRVTVRPDTTRYQPGGTAHLAILTRDASGAAVSASVIVRVIDEKLYAIGAAQDVDLLGDLYAPVSDGILWSGWSHRLPEQGGEGGDTTGGGGDERTDFRDWLLFRQVTTGSDGRASVDVPLSDDLTSWRALASGVDAKLDAGSGIANLRVGLPFFADAILGPTYLVGETPILRMRGFGLGLGASDQVTFEVSAPSLGLAPQTVTAKAFQAASVGSGSARLRDALVRTIKVIPTRSVATRTATAPLTAGFEIQGGTDGLTTMVLGDAGRGRVLPVLLGLADSAHDTGRLDETLAGAVAQSVLTDAFKMPASDVSVESLDLTPYGRDQGLGLFPYASADLELSVFAALSDDPAVSRQDLEQYFGNVRGDTAETPERQRIALVGLAAIGDPVGSEIRDAAADTSLTPTDRAWLAVGALATGDESLATDLERGILAANGQRLGPWVRVWTGDTESSATTTALLDMVAAGIGDPLAADLDAYIGANPPKDTLVDLQRAIAARDWAARTPGQDAMATLTVDGVTRQVAVKPLEPGWVVLTPAQLASATLAPVSGSIVVTSTWEAPLQAATLQPKGVDTFTRTVTPNGTIGPTDTVVVGYNVTFASDAPKDCWRIVDQVPSGLAPIGHPTPAEDESVRFANGPVAIVGQRVDFCASPDDQMHSYQYLARVVSPGSYQWEPAVLQSSVLTELGRTIPATQVTITNP